MPLQTGEFHRFPVFQWRLTNTFELVIENDGRPGFWPRFRTEAPALKGPLAISKINAFHTKIFQSHTRFYNDLQIGCPI